MSLAPEQPAPSPRLHARGADRLWNGAPMASWGYRVGAALVDGGAAALGAGLVALLAGAAGASPRTAFAAGTTLCAVLWFLDVVVLAGLSGGRSVGYRLAAVRAVRESGRRYGVGAAFVREVVCRLLFVIPFVGLADALLPLGEQRQTLRDRMVSVRVLQQPAYRARRWPLAGAAALVSAGWIAVAIASGAFAGDFHFHGGFHVYLNAHRRALVEGCSRSGGSAARHAV